MNENNENMVLQEELDSVTPQININTSDISDKLEKILEQIKADRDERLKEKELLKKEEEKKLKEEKKIEEENKKIEEEKEQEKEEFLDNIKVLTENTDVSYQTELNDLLVSKLDEQIFVTKMEITFLSVLVAILLVKIFSDTFRR